MYLYGFDYYIIVKIIHLQDKHKHKHNQTKEDYSYNSHMYFHEYKTRLSASVNDMKYLLSIILIIVNDVVEVGENLEYTLVLNTNQPKIKYEQGFSN